MLTLIIYDIEETKNRNDLIKKLRHYGLIRIQKSAFSGYLNHDKRLMIKKIALNKKTLSVILIEKLSKSLMHKASFLLWGRLGFDGDE